MLQFTFLKKYCPLCFIVLVICSVLAEIWPRQPEVGDHRQESQQSYKFFFNLIFFPIFFLQMSTLYVMVTTVCDTRECEIVFNLFVFQQLCRFHHDFLINTDKFTQMTRETGIIDPN